MRPFLVFHTLIATPKLKLIWEPRLESTNLKTWIEPLYIWQWSTIGSIEFLSSCSCSCSCRNSTMCQRLMWRLNTGGNNDLCSIRSRVVIVWRVWRWREWSWCLNLKPTRLTRKSHVWVRRWLTHPRSYRTLFVTLVLHYCLVNKRNKTLHFLCVGVRENKRKWKRFWVLGCVSTGVNVSWKWAISWV